ncbi:class I SAM-dependent methyltransferase [Erythrobacter crassostreae]|uniref:Class I SAM-dependent methyltransferase n=1 Tax=Erythrobacter crassostreae TaxID=2828328 RepID=A0A9X1F482_9SPHN|nr:class I SAM-dependent methyltransferase [Erythrobacter crassostrea]MBV7258515.1 class I SAM-dependent methyltransferase [Erythrobacter crassostrea]
MEEIKAISGYEYEAAGHNPSHDYLLPQVISELDVLKANLGDVEPRLFELGCGNGSIAATFAARGWQVFGVDPSEQGIKQAVATHPELNLKQGSAYDDLASEYGQFPVVTSLEVIEHVYAPRKYAETLFNLLEPGGTAIISTPYHGYWKNLVMALTGKMDAHFTALWDHGHIKFWSEKTLCELFAEIGFEAPKFYRVGRIGPLAKSTIAVIRKPAT